MKKNLPEFEAGGGSDLARLNFPRSMFEVQRRTSNILSRQILVELEGVEPSSKQAAHVVSTCLAFPWLSGRGRRKASLPRPYPFNFTAVSGLCNCYPDFCDAPAATPPGRVSRGADGYLILDQAAIA